MPKSSSAQGACSRLGAAAKLAPATSSVPCDRPAGWDESGFSLPSGV